ncbi:unnamed protein product [Owenia fusiformis]|uniref:Guanylate cyclase n=1 Tax=Owenia fusiformis TaxID=6347 RepID=A0A8S4P0I2_OWEFU|nr:unnamed protein product [Owenia fusiformis]
MWNIQTTTLCVFGLIFEIYGITEINVGVLIIDDDDSPYSIKRTGAAVDLAIAKVNSEILNSDFNLTVHKQPYGGGCTAAKAPGKAADLYYNEGIAALIGPACTSALEPVARLAGYWNIPIVTGLGDYGIFKNKTNFPTLTRMAYCQCRLRKVFGSVFSQFNWTDISIIYDRDDAHAMTIGQTLDVGLKKGGIEPHMIQYNGQSEPDYSSMLEEASRHSRVIILSAPGDAIRRLMIAAYTIGYTSGDYVFMDVELFKSEYWGDHDWKRNDTDDSIAKQAYESLLRVALMESQGVEFQTFSEEIKSRSLRDYNFDFEDEQVNFFIGSFYDGILLYGMALNETLDVGGDIRDGWNMSRRMWNRTFKGVTGEVIIDENGDRDTSYSILDMHPDTGDFHPVAHYWGDRPGYNPKQGVSIHWPNDKGPPGSQNVYKTECGFTNDSPDCQEKDPIITVFIIVITILIALLLVGTLSFMIYRKFKQEASIRDTSWIVTPDEIVYTLKGVGLSKQSLLQSTNSINTKSTNSMVVGVHQIFIPVANYRGHRCAVKTIAVKRLQLNRETLLHINRRRELQHENIARFIGATVAPPKLFVLMEFCEKGSLEDVLANTDINLDWSFKRSLIQDIVNGMFYIHTSPVKCHGKLKSSNCVVTGRFTVKITDFGLRMLYDDTSVKHLEHKEDNSALWIAPEILRGSDTRATQQGDVFSFAIILQEIITRQMPYGEVRDTLDVKDIIGQIKAANPVLRPKVDHTCPHDVKDLLQKCWLENPDERPDFKSINMMFRKSSKGTGNIMDNLLKRMEVYANNLEHIVEDRTSQLIVEKKKSEELLHQILPKAIAERLMNGLAVDPESFDNVTIYFSDIIGFTSLSSNSTPLQIVELLNDLYTVFDSILENHDVYKVETIGDAYMVVSGLPIRNGSNHAKEIASMSVSILGALLTFRIRHLPKEKLNIRIGLHSGPCVAGVVGLKMPRYCLFGDTVNTASRMETNGEALRIHISDVTKRALSAHGNEFTFESRGSLEVKGKGTMKTYWLISDQHGMQDYSSNE